MVWKSRQALRVVDGFIAAVNAHDARSAAQLLHPDVTYIDSAGGRIRGRDDCALALERFAHLDDLFTMHIDKKTVTLPEVLLTGFTTARDPRLASKTLWRAEVRDGMLYAWQSFGRGNPPPLARMLMQKRPTPVGGSFASLLVGTP